MRAERLGVALTVPKKRYNPNAATRALRRLLNEPSFIERAAEVSETVKAENGAATAADALEALLDGKTRNP